MLATVLSIPAIAFSIGSYNLNAYTYPAWSNILTLAICTTMIILFIENLQDIQKEAPTGVEPARKFNFIYLSRATVLGFFILTFNGILASSLAYALPIVMYDLYGW